MSIQKLSKTLIAQISAGEVIETPAGVLKELLENSIDAEATEIQIFIKDKGYELIQVNDNGKGISKKDLPLAVESFATSKLFSTKDLFNIHSLGFRGEALGSIRSVSRLSIESKTKKQSIGCKISTEVDKISDIESIALTQGTRIIVKDLFFNIPVRKEFNENERLLKKSFIDIVTNYAFVHPHISIEYYYDDNLQIQWESTKNLSLRIQQIFSDDFFNGLMPIYFKDPKTSYELSGYISTFSFYKSNGSFIKFFVNNRWIEYKKLVGIFRSVYGELMPPGRFPVTFLFLNLPAKDIDVNIHPQKKQIQFKEEDKIRAFLLKALRIAIEGAGPIRARNLRNPKNRLAKNISYDNNNSLENQKFDFQIPIQETSTFQEPIVDSNNKQPLEELKKKVEADVQSSLKNNFISNQYFLPQQAHTTLFNTFILASSDEGVFLIDQHTAHERINYERFKKSLAKQSKKPIRPINTSNNGKNISEEKIDTNKLSQTLLDPIALNLSPAENLLLKDKESKKLIQQLGFEIEDLGPAGFVLTNIPFYIESGLEEQAFQKSLSIIEQDGNIDAVILFDELAKSLSCTNAIKKGDAESLYTLSELISQLSKCDNPGRCPHGRPTIVFLDKKDIFELFKRRT